MTPPINAKVQTPVVTTGSVGLNASFKEYGADRIVLFGPTVEGKVEHKDFYASAGVTAGTGLSVGAEVGKEFDINKNWGLNLSANANHTRALLGENKTSIIMAHNLQVNRNDIANNTSVETRGSAQWKPAITTAGVKAMANYTTDNGKFTFGAGLSGQYAKNNAKDISLTATVKDNNQAINTATSAIKRREEGFVLSPELKAGWNANKHISFEANVNGFGGGVTAKYTF